MNFPIPFVFTTKSHPGQRPKLSTSFFNLFPSPLRLGRLPFQDGGAKRKSLPLLLLLSLFQFSSAAISLSFSGGNGAPLVITINDPVTYQVTETFSGTSGPIFVADGVGGTGFLIGTIAPNNVSYSVNGGPTVELTSAYFGVSSGVLTSDDWYFWSAPEVPSSYLQVGDTVTLSSGTFTSAANFNYPPPPSGEYATYVMQSGGNLLGQQVVPEPGVSLLSLVGTLCLMLRRRARR